MSIAVGILATGIYIPAQKMKADVIAEASGLSEHFITGKLGLLEKPIADSHETVSYMGAEASKVALKKAQISAKEIDLILSVSSEYKAYPFQLSSIKIQQLIGASQAWSIDLSQNACTLVSALHIAKRMMQSDPLLKTILIAGGTREHDRINLADNDTKLWYAAAAGGGAIILRRSHDANLLWGSSIMSDADFVDDVYQVQGGSASTHVQDLAANHAYLQIHALEDFSTKFKERFAKNFQLVIQNALACSEEIHPISYLALMHVQRTTHVKMLRNLGLRLDQSYYLERYGQMGALDPILSLELGIQAKRVQKGSTLVMASSGIGKSWGAQVIRWG